ncbi:phage repressor protein [Natrinema sp. CBA1119]|uniref:phage repressor protein n=1 Tax=Natrinema sp. CBA1119 TaxID=1608465 RepID=UPI000BFA2B39|nr:phage repressor protein [Natrinema sp. CBA1119]PGF15778.1 phage repressor protein [Natrinema sp. CBA1119]
MRKHAEWMAYADERVLEFLSEYGNHQPSQIADRLGKIGNDLDFHPNYIGRRCRKLTDYGLIQNLGNGLYSITDDGTKYLNGDLDASTLEIDSE